jgi:NADH dehydrogenase
MAEEQKRIVVVGGGFAGVDAAKRLRRELPETWEIVLYNRENHLCFSPLLPEVVGASLNPLHVVWSIREMAPGVVCRTTAVTAFDFEAAEIEYLDGTGLPRRDRYDHLVLAVGLPVRLEIIEGMAEHGWPIKTLGDAAALRNHLIAQLERAEVTEDPQARAELLSVAIVGGGFTGVEVAGAVLDLFQASVPYYSTITASDCQVHLLDGGPRILGPLPSSLSDVARKSLSDRGMKIREGVGVEAVERSGVRLAGGDSVAAGTVVSAVGNGTHPLIAGSGLVLERGRVVVAGDLRVEGRENIWALGDCAGVPNAFDDSISPTLAQHAMQQARLLSDNLIATIHGKPTSLFSYEPKGMFCVIGHRNAVGRIYGRNISGLLAWLLWHAVYWAKMPTFARKVQVAVDWLWDACFPRDIAELSMEQTQEIEAKHGKASRSASSKNPSAELHPDG